MANKHFGTRQFYLRALSIALPVMAQFFIQHLVSLIDNFMVADLGDIKMSGVNVAAQINFVFLILITNVLCAAGGIFMSQFKGAENPSKMKEVFRFKILVCVFFAAPFTALSVLNPAPVLALMIHGNAAGDEILASAVLYQKALAPMWIPFAISSAISSSLRETGEVRAPLFISIFATLTNTFLNYILIYGKFGAPRLEVEGAAIATVTARVFEMLVFLWHIKKTKPQFHTRLRDIFCVGIPLAGTILAKAGMVALSEMTWVVSETITTALYNSRGGAEIVSGMAAGFTIANLFFVSFSGIFTATGVVMGTTLGSGRLDEARRQKSWILNGSLVFGIIFGALGCACTLFIPLVFGSLSAASQSTARGLILVASAYMPVWCYLNAQFAVSRTGGDTMMGLIVDLSANILMVIPGMFAMTYLTNWHAVLMYAIIKISDIYKIIPAAIWLKKEKWLKNLAKENAA